MKQDKIIAMYALTKENPYDLLKNPLPDDKQCVISNTSIIFLGDSKLQENHGDPLIFSFQRCKRVVYILEQL